MLCEWVQHIPRARQHQITYAGWFANALGKLNPKPAASETLPVEEPKSSRWVKWRTLILRCWAVDPELCPRCHKEMKRAKALLDQHELQRLLKNLGIGLYPARPRSPPPPRTAGLPPGPDENRVEQSQFSDPDSQVPANWDEWEAA